MQFDSFPNELYGVIIDQTQSKYKFDVYKKIMLLCWHNMDKNTILKLFFRTLVTKLKFIKCKFDNGQFGIGEKCVHGYYHNGKFVKHSIIHNKTIPGEIIYCGDRTEIYYM